LPAIPYGIASLHGEAKKRRAKNRAGNGIKEMHINLILISNLILSLEKAIVEFVRVSQPSPGSKYISNSAREIN
jgi:hypothetical protein